MAMQFWNGTAWEAIGGATTLDALTDVAGTTAGSTGQVLTKQGDGQWRPATPATGGGAATGFDPGTGANVGAPVFDLLVVAVRQIRYKSITRTMTVKELAQTERIMREFPALMHYATAGRFGVRVRSRIHDTLWDLDAAVAGGASDAEPYSATPGNYGYWINGSTSLPITNLSNGSTYDGRAFIVGVSQFDPGAFGLSRNNYSFCNVADTFHDSDQAANRTVDILVHEFLHQVEYFAQQDGATTLGLHENGNYGYGSPHPRRNFMDWYRYFVANSGLNAMTDDGVVATAHPRTTPGPLRTLDIDNPWGTLTGTAGGGGGSGQSVIAIDRLGTPVRTNPTAIGVREGLQVNINGGGSGTGVDILADFGSRTGTDPNKLPRNSETQQRFDINSAPGVLVKNNPDQIVAGTGIAFEAVAGGVTISATGAGGGGATATNLSATHNAGTVDVLSDTGTDATINAATTTLAGAMTATDKTKLNGVATSATANATDAQLRDRTTHTGAQAQATVTNLTTDLAAKAPLASPAFTGTPTGITKAHVGLGSVDNTADADKPVSTAQAAADATKQVIIAVDQLGTLVKSNPNAIGFREGLRASLNNGGAGPGVDVLADFGRGFNQLRRGSDNQDDRFRAERATADRTTSVVTAANVTDMAFPVAASEAWAFDMVVSNGCNGTGGLKWAIDVPTGATIRAIVEGMSSGPTAETSSVITADATLTTQVYNNVVSTTGWTRISGTVANGATAGTLQLQFASVTAGQVSTVYANSRLTAQRIG